MLSKRLQAVASFVSPDAILADIGSDHALLPCSLVLGGRIQKAYACEVKEGPLASTLQTIRARQLEGQVIPLLQDGLKNLPSDVNEVVIAGMGVQTILSILQQEEWRLPQLHRIIVQANQNVEFLRAYLSKQNYRILAEAMVWEDKYYEIVVFEARNGKRLDEVDCYFGPFLRQEKSDIFLSYYQMRYEALMQIRSNVSCESKRYQEITDELSLIHRVCLVEK